ncbi:MAG TPA: CBS domain-containing protein [Polyangia bacterium]|nr:CBS domain-containing protein [Polyangia bacterium]
MITVREGEVKSEFDEAYDDDQGAIRGAIFAEPLGKVPRRPTVTVQITVSAGEAVRVMNQEHVGCALVLANAKLVGIFTERDVLTKLAGRGLDLERTPIEQVMTAAPDTLPASASIAYALRKMTLEGYRHIPIVNPDGTPAGVVAVRDIVAWMVELFPESIYNLPPEPGFPRNLDGG